MSMCVNRSVAVVVSRLREKCLPSKHNDQYHCYDIGLTKDDCYKTLEIMISEYYVM